MNKTSRVQYHYWKFDLKKRIDHFHSLQLCLAVNLLCYIYFIFPFRVIASSNETIWIEIDCEIHLINSIYMPKNAHKNIMRIIFHRNNNHFWNIWVSTLDMRVCSHSSKFFFSLFRWKCVFWTIAKYTTVCESNFISTVY